MFGIRFETKSRGKQSKYINASFFIAFRVLQLTESFLQGNMFIRKVMWM